MSRVCVCACVYLWKWHTDPIRWWRALLITILLALISIVKHDRATSSSTILDVWSCADRVLVDAWKMNIIANVVYAVNIAPLDMFCTRLACHPIVPHAWICEQKTRRKLSVSFVHQMKTETDESAACVFPTPSTRCALAYLAQNFFVFRSSHMSCLIHIFSFPAWQRERHWQQCRARGNAERMERKSETDFIRDCCWKLIKYVGMNEDV